MKVDHSVVYFPVRITLSIGLLVSILGILFGNSTCKPGKEEDEVSLELFSQSLQLAKDSGQKVLLVFGADWCRDCNSLKERFQDHPKISSLLREHYLILYIDVGRFDKNLKFAETFGSPQKKGIPALVIVDPAKNGKILASTKGGEFSNAGSMEDESIYSYLSQFVNEI